MELFTSILLESSMENEFERIQKNEILSSKKIPYTSDYLDMMLEYFEYEEEYEKCIVVNKYKKNKLLHESRFIEFN